MIQGCVMDRFVLLCLSIFHSFLRCHSFCFFSLRKAIISITLHISAKFTVSVHAWPKGRKSHSVGAEFHFLACTCCFLWFVHGGNYNVILFHGCTQYSKARQWLLLLKFWLWFNLCTCISPEIASWLWGCVFSHAFKVNRNGSSALDHQESRNIPDPFVWNRLTDKPIRKTT